MEFYIAIVLCAVIVGIVSFFLAKNTYGYIATYGRGKKKRGPIHVEESVTQRQVHKERG